MTFSQRMFEIVRPFMRALAISFGYVLVVRIFSLVAPVFLGRMTQIGMRGGTFEEMLPWAMLGLIAYGIHERSGWQHGIFDTKYLTGPLKRHVRFEGIRHIKSLSIGQSRGYNSDHVREIAKSGESSFAELLFGVLHSVSPVLVEALGVSLILLCLEPSIGVLFFVVCVLYLGYIWRTNDSFLPEIVQDQRRQSEVGRMCAEFVAHLPTIQVNVQEDRLVHEIEEEAKSAEAQAIVLWVRYMVVAGRRGFIAAFGIYGIYSFAAWLMQGNPERGKNLVMIVMWIQMGFSEVWKLSTLYRNLVGHHAAVKCFFEFFDVKNPLRSPENPHVFSDVRGEITIEDLSYRYPRYRLRKANEEKVSLGVEEPCSPVLALSHVGMLIPAGKNIAIVGQSGSGKSTLAWLLLRMDDPLTGRIMLDGIDIRRADPQEVRRHFAYLEQNVTLPSGSLRNALTFACGGATAVSDERIREVMRIARLEMVLSRLGKAGLGTPIGQNGIELSGGERQRVGIARALLRDPRVLVLDEPTASLDAETESLFMEACRELMRARTCITIAHRLSTIVNADIIFVMKGGVVVSSGNHETLYERCSTYHALVDSQLPRKLRSERSSLLYN